MNRTLFNRRILITIMGILLFFISNGFAQSNDECLMCHDDDTFTAKIGGKEVSLYVNGARFDKSVHSKLNCIFCHKGYDPNEIPHTKTASKVNCLNCHEKAKQKHLFHPQILNSNGIGGPADVNCKNCHGTHYIISPTAPGSKFYKANIVDACGSCHKDEKAKFETSAHANGLREKILGAPNCLTCHKNPIVAATVVTDSLQLKIAQEKLCLSCHLNNAEIRERTSPSAGFISSYENSIHGKELNSGNAKVANCVNCHSAHRVKPAGDPTSTVNRFNVPNTCGKCHTSIKSEYDQSIHGQALLKHGSMDTPVCTTCHGEHNIMNPSNPKAPTSYANVAQYVCAKCHGSVALSTQYGLNPNRWTSFRESYHGLALQGGSTTVANCASCHGIHLILPSSNPESSINKNNLAKTCGKCHPGATKNFGSGDIHQIGTEKSDPIIFWIATTYIILIISVIGAMLLHNIFDFFKKAKIKKLKQRGMIREVEYSHALYLRMNLNERIQHLFFNVSFIVLVITGFMLQFPNAWWVSHIRDVVENAFEYRSLLHRIAAVIMIITSFYHIYYISFTKRGKQLIKDLFPKRQDLFDAIGVAKFNLGLSKTKPKLDRFSYVEKAEYWALIWGTIIMSATGIIMWFNNTFIDLLTLLGWQIARTVHYYEAILATLAIIVWHFYFVIFNPDIYPMNTSWITGYITEEELADEHPLEYERIKSRQKGEHTESK